MAVLMTRSRRTLTPMEDLVHGAICDLLRLKGHRNTVWLHIPNGVPANARIGARFVRLGLLKGAADLLVIPPGGRAHFLEVKSSTGILSEAQKAFRSRCEEAGIPYAIARSSREAEAILANWGALYGTPSQMRRAA